MPDKIQIDWDWFLATGNFREKSDQTDYDLEITKYIMKIRELQIKKHLEDRMKNQNNEE